MQQIADWLKKLGMSEYAERFAENRIDLSVLPDLTDQHLEKLGVALGDRLKILRAIRELCATTVAAQPGPSAAPVVQDSAERRQLTVMFCDLVGSTALSAKLDPEDLRGIIAAYHHCCTELVERNGGFVAKYMGDGVLAYFGYPQTHEHDAERAVRAGLALVESAPRLSTSAGAPLQVRIGIATGLVVVGDLIGAGAAQEQAVVGETPNLAARLQALAEPGAVVIASNTRRLTGGLFEYRDLGAVAVKGFAESVPAWQVLRVGTADSRFEALRATTTPLVGREEEIDLLVRRWQQAKNGDGQVVLISGEPGIGKSRITQALAERLSAEAHTRLRYFCSPHHQDSALYPSIAQLERAAGFRRDDTDEQRLAKLEGVLAEGTNDLSEAVPLLAALLSISIGDRYPPLNLTPQKRKEKTFHVQLAQIEGLAAHEPLLMVWEDVHWSDPTTRESLDLLIERVPTLRVLVIITFRPEFAPPWIARPHVTMLNLNRLPSARCAEMIMHTAGGKALPKEIADQIIDRTDGVPLFVEELTKTVLESGVVAETVDRYTMIGPVALVAIPTTLHGSLLARLDRLAPTREVAQIASALGRQFSYELISAVVTIPKQQLDEALAQLMRAELVFQRGTPPDAKYTFKHALVQDATYSTLLRSRRLQLHARIAAILEGQFPETVETRPELLAQHCAEAGMVENAVGYWLKAGQRAFARWALAEAISQLRKGLGLLSSMSDGPARQARELDLQIALGQAFVASRGYTASESVDAYARARELCDQLDRPRQLISVLDAQAATAMYRGELKAARRIAEEQLELGEARQDPIWTVMGCMTSGSLCLLLGEFIAARQYLERGLGLYDPSQHSIYAALAAEDPRGMMLFFLSGTLHFLGHLDQARLRIRTAENEARRLGHLLTLGHAYFGMTLSQMSVGSFDEAIKCSEDLLALVEKHDMSFFWPVATTLRGRCLVALGQGRAGVELLELGLAPYRASGVKGFLPMCLAFMADAYLSVGQHEQGLKLIAEAEEETQATAERFHEAATLCVRGKLLLAVQDTAAADESFQRALAIARHQSARLWELRAGLDLTRLWRDQGKHSEARDLLGPIYGWFTEGFDTPVLKEAKALLDQLV
jgi:class 3 adenylate cyclase/tetratricopeptide (TPR) repeat protein